MKALLGLGDLVSNVNIPNHGAIANLPWDAVVEVNALFSRQGVQSVNAGPLPANILPPRLQSGEHPNHCPDLRPHPWPDHLYERPAGDPELEPGQRAV